MATDFLSGRTPLNEPAIPIFFNKLPGTREDFEKFGGAKEQGKNFFWCSDNPDESRIVVLNDGDLFIAIPTRPVEFWKTKEPLGYASPGDHIKLLPIEIVYRASLASVPGILASMSANAYYYTGTFREIADFGNKLALRSLLKLPTPEIASAAQLLLCLGSIELETLIAKIFEESGCFVPAYRGGAVKNVDIFAKNIGDDSISVGTLDIPPNKSISIQVKRHTSMVDPPPGCDVLVSVDKDADWLLQALRNLPSTKSWLKSSLSWAPKKGFEKLEF